MLILSHSLCLFGRCEAFNGYNVGPSLYAMPFHYTSAYNSNLLRYRSLKLTQPSPNWERSPSLQSDKISESREVKRWIDSYLGVGEWVMDQSVAILGSSRFFERRR